MRKIREILRLRAAGKSQHLIALSVGIGQSTVGDCLTRARLAGVSWPTLLDDEALERALYPPRPAVPSAERGEPDWAEVHRELKRKGVTLFLLWEEYKSTHPNGFQYSWFCQRYRAYAGKLDLVMRQTHRAGETMFVDYAGQTVPVVNRDTGELREAQIFVAALGASSYTFARASWTQSLPDWIDAHCRAFTFFGGVTETLVPDNLKAGVTHPHRYEPELNPTYTDMATHYGVVVLPTRVAKPRDKSLVSWCTLFCSWDYGCGFSRRRFLLPCLVERLAAAIGSVHAVPPSFGRNDSAFDAGVALRSSQSADGSGRKAELLSHFRCCAEVLLAKPFLLAFAIARQAVHSASAAQTLCGVRLALPVLVSHPVELSCGGFIGVRVKQLVERGDRLVRRLADLCNRSRQVECFKGQGPASAHAQLDRDLVAVAGQRCVFDQVSEQPLAIGVPGFGSVPYLLEVTRQVSDAFGLPRGEFVIAGRGAGLALAAGLLQNTQPLVPVRFERCRHQAVGRVDLEEPATRQIGLVADALDAPGALGIGVGELRTDLLLHREGKVDVLSVHHVDHEARYPGVDPIAEHALTSLSTITDQRFLAHVVVARRSGQIFVLLRVVSERSMARDGCSS